MPPPARKPKKPRREKPWDPARHEATLPPRWGFLKGALLGFVFALPVTATAVWVLAHLGLGDPTSYRRTLRFALVFAGIPAMLSAGGAGRVAARAAIARATTPVRRSVRAGALTFAPAGAGLVLLTALALGGPASRAGWGFLALIGIGCGLVVGGVIGLWAGSPIPVTPATLPAPEPAPPPTTAPTPPAPPATL